MKKGLLSSELTGYDSRTFEERLSRFRYAIKATGRKAPFMLPESAVGYFYDADVCLVFGAFAACIIMCQLVCEEMLKSPYRDKGDRRIVESNFSKLIEIAFQDGHIDARTVKELNRLRRFRNAITHSKDYSRLSNPKERSHIMIMFGYTANDSRLERKAKNAFLITSKLLRRGLYLLE